jgi:hypothetical protein
VRGAKHRGAHCDCPPSCFLCLEKRLPGKDHIATDDSCPLRKLFRTNLRAAITAAVPVAPPAPSTPSAWSPTPPPAARIDDPNTLADITPSPAADGPFSLISDLGQAVPPTPKPHTNPRIAQLLAEGKTPDEIMRIFAEAAGYVPNV